MAFRKGYTPWNKGKKMTESFCKKISKARRGTKLSMITRKRISKSNMGNQHGKKTWFKKGHPPFNNTKPYFKKGHIPWNKGLRGYNSGEKHPQWQGGITSETMKIRNSLEMQEWRKTVYKRDNFLCWICEVIGGKLHAHHLKSFANYPRLRFVVNNGMTLCKFCHKTYTPYLKRFL